ncbi:hypothetical protein QEH56_19105 [Pelagicoccus enzymogenes]|uniref:hypothetical protein n=1 Tax=Pelagicoccus enzymogenes TaxID=2773457 RepID=UPI00280D1044|nr:hypothetical protein [Pelagicoccus enzymogenes]MDQ8200280.1 hypothetical protein [Pelagicoccus enzymogenes]
MLHKLQILAAAACLLLSTRFHIAAIQGVAWASMYAGYQQSLSPIEAIERTFSGDAPCDLCIVSIEIREEAEESPDRILSFSSVVLLPPTQKTIFVAPPQSTFHRRLIPLSRIPQALIREIEPPPPKSHIC